MTVTAVIAGLGFLIGGLALAGLAAGYHRQGYRPAWWLRLLLVGTAVIMVLIAAGYVAIVAGWGERALVQAFWLRPLVATFAVAVPVLALYALRQTAVHEDMITQQIEFRQNASHELRTPLTIILGFSEMLRERLDTPETMREYLGYIHHQAQNMNELVRDLLYFDRARAIDPIANGRPVALSGLVHQVVTMVGAARAQPAGVDLAVEHADVLTVHGLAADLERMVNNLVINGVKFSPPGETGGTVRVSLLRIQKYALLIVQDTGVGIDPAFIPHLFQPFRQGDGSDTRRFGGVGMGLAVVKRIVQAHNGRIEVESKPGKGTAVRVYLPLAAGGGDG